MTDALLLLIALELLPVSLVCGGFLFAAGWDVVDKWRRRRAGVRWRA